MTTKTVTRPLTEREYYAQMGVNYDKATRRFIAQHSDDTVRFTAEEVQNLVSAATAEVVS